MNIGLFGIKGTYNFGCEAIIRGATIFISDIFPNAKVFYFSFSYEYDKKILSDLDLTIIPVYEKAGIVSRALNKGLYLINSEHRVFTYNIKELFKDIDYVFSIGGDIYTIPVYIRQRKKYRYYNWLVDLCNRCKKPIIVYGSSIGPFGDYYKAIEYYKKNLENYKAIICRENHTIEYLQKIGLKNIYFSPDPAFLLGGQKNYNGSYIGVNLSPLSMRELYGNELDKHIDILAKTFDKIYKETQRELLFLPHVISQDSYDNDLMFLLQIKDHMNFPNKVLIADSSSGFFGLKNSIRKCHIVISARMHCAINALEENVPTIFLSYSQKSYGMCEYIYNSNKWIVDIRNSENDLLALTLEISNKRDEISHYLSYRNTQIMIEYNKFVQEIKSDKII